MAVIIHRYPEKSRLNIFQVDLYLLPGGMVPLAKPSINVLVPWLPMSEGRRLKAKVDGNWPGFAFLGCFLRMHGGLT